MNGLPEIDAAEIEAVRLDKGEEAAAKLRAERERGEPCSGAGAVARDLEIDADGLWCGGRCPECGQEVEPFPMSGTTPKHRRPRSHQ